MCLKINIHGSSGPKPNKKVCEIEYVTRYNVYHHRKKAFGLKRLSLKEDFTG